MVAAGRSVAREVGTVVAVGRQAAAVGRHAVAVGRQAVGVGLPGQSMRSSLGAPSCQRLLLLEGRPGSWDSGKRRVRAMVKGSPFFRLLCRHVRRMLHQAEGPYGNPPPKFKIPTSTTSACEACATNIEKGASYISRYAAKAVPKRFRTCYFAADEQEKAFTDECDQVPLSNNTAPTYRKGSTVGDAPTVPWLAVGPSSPFALYPLNEDR